MRSRLEEGVDYYIEDGKFVFTALYHYKRGHCCNSGCRHCPYREDSPPVEVPPIQIIGVPVPDDGSSG